MTKMNRSVHKKRDIGRLAQYFYKNTFTGGGWFLFNDTQQTAANKLYNHNVVVYCGFVSEDPKILKKPGLHVLLIFKGKLYKTSADVLQFLKIIE